MRVCLPWEVRGASLTGFFPLLHNNRVSVSTQYSAKSGRISVLFFNFGQDVAVIAAKTFIIGVGSREATFFVRTVDGTEHQLWDGMGIECGARDWSVASVSSEERFFSQFPLLFSEDTCEIPEAMYRFEIRRERLTLMGSMTYRGKCAFNVENLVPAKAIDDTITEMLANGYVEEVKPSHRLMLHPLIFLPKPDGRTRLVIDLRRINGHTFNTEGGLPAIHTIFRQIPTTWKYFCKLDLKNGYHRVPLGVTIRDLFAFGINRKFFRYKVLPQGWSASPYLFHEIIMRICRSHDVLHYIDDIILGAATMKELERRVMTLLERLSKFGLQVQRKKFVFGAQRIDFLGFAVMSGGRVSAEEYLASRRMAVESNIQTRKGLQSLLGTLNVARHFVPNLADKTLGLQRILKSMKSSQMTTDEMERVQIDAAKAWDAVLKSCVSLQMGSGVAVREFELFTDWSTTSMGYVLFAITEGGSMIADVNSAVSTLGSTISSFLGELRGIAWALQKVRHIIWTAPVKICCDNAGTVQRLQRMEAMGGDVRCSRLMVWTMENFPQAKFEYIPGIRNVLADYLSRKNTKQGKEVRSVGVVQQRPTEEEVKRRIESAHRGHWHAERTWQHLKRDGDTWPGAREEVLDYVRRCPNCQHFRGLEHREPWRGIETSRPNEVVYGDFLGPITLSKGRGKRVLLILVDGFSRYTHIHMARGPTEGTVIRGLRRWLLTLTWRHGQLKMLLTDKGAAFTGRRLRDFCMRHGVGQRWTASHAPWSNGAAERQVGNVKARLARMLWRFSADLSIHELEDVLNGGICQGTGFTPYEICWGRRRDGSLMTAMEWTEAMHEARRRRETGRHREEERYRRKYPKKPSLLPGQWVLAYEPHKKGHALHSPWTGPHLTSSPRGTKLWMLWQNGATRLIGPFHAEHLRHYNA